MRSGEWFAGRGALPTLAFVLLSASGSWAQTVHQHAGGFWKCKATGAVKGEFNGEDPVGLASGKHIPTDCAIAQRADHKIYCFSSLPSLDLISSNPELLQKAHAFWDKEHPASETH